ncbi:GIY-YIG nuclease family protein [Azospirillum picis]|uniref:Bacteriophage T5 Orf172 DNA-binding domain-containing protein n=1 Tax=Azospirillum picis TaxID=488438 RepID=A0ABU0MUI7_9PROT|nr:GIY-YIG nuclease family protein [Azospirillum picis]MBP2303297.1 hypothetical protein [Azospirillum picis]MDQ0537163.1 hypothetical protein [Azospirillum picis]
MIRWRVAAPARAYAILPPDLPSGSGVVYAVLFSNDLVKVGYSSKPRRRVASVVSEMDRHHGARPLMIGCTPPLPNAASVEAILLARLAPPLLGREWFGVPAFERVPKLLASVEANAPIGLPMLDAVRQVAAVRRQKGKREAQAAWRRLGLPAL